MTELASYLSTGWVDADGAVQLFLGHATFHGCTEALRHLSCVWTQIVEPDDSILQCVGVTVTKYHLCDTTRGQVAGFYELRFEDLCEQCKSSNHLTLSSLLQMILE